MFRRTLISIVILFISSSPLLAEERSALACNHNTGQCYDADIDTYSGTVSIKISEKELKILDIDDEDSEDITAYDSITNVYYDIEITD